VARAHCRPLALREVRPAAGVLDLLQHLLLAELLQRPRLAAPLRHPQPRPAPRRASLRRLLR
jgi:hypothetical protein